jgi:tetratricopeptide (TPR) repeat protein
MWLQRLATGALIVIAGCATRRTVSVAPDPQFLDELSAADRLVRAGCLTCLQDAHQTYTILRSIPQTRDAATVGAFRTAVLLAVRERELGLEESGYFGMAQDLLDGGSVPLPYARTLLNVAETLPSGLADGRLTDDAELSRREAALRQRAMFLAFLGEHPDGDALSAYLLISFSCAYRFSGAADTVTVSLDVLPSWRDTPLLAFKAATCGDPSPDALNHLLNTDPRFVEVHYPLGVAAKIAGETDAAVDHWQRAAAWRARWPAVTQALGTASLAFEDFDQAVNYFDRTLLVTPDRPDALLGKAEALTYGGHHADALVSLDRLLTVARWNLGDAHYFRALNEAQLGRNDAAWADVELAAKSVINADVPKLAGVIAYRRQQLDIARTKFELARGRNRRDCEIQFYLGMVLSEQKAWSETAQVLRDAATCLTREAEHLRAEIAEVRASNQPADRQTRQIARREQQIASGERLKVTAWFNLAVASYNLSRVDDARSFAEQVGDDAQFGGRARELIRLLRQ